MSQEDIETLRIEFVISTSKQTNKIPIVFHNLKINDPIILCKN